MGFMDILSSAINVISDISKDQIREKEDVIRQVERKYKNSNNENYNKALSEAKESLNKQKELHKKFLKK